MPTEPDLSTFSTFLITTSTDPITFFRSRTTAYSEASIGDTTPRTASVGCAFELNEPAVVQWAGGGSYTGGRVLSVAQVADSVFVPVP
ncbi:hypothetical protein RCH12_002718 [Cryobacterium sp. MP_3.1]|nr:hypothetical protein [Cryobacterium sp. MP_3.1]